MIRILALLLATVLPVSAIAGGLGMDPRTAEFVVRAGITASEHVGRERIARAATALTRAGWPDSVAYPMTASTNENGSATVHPLGGLTTNTMTLVDGPTWSADGVVFTPASSSSIPWFITDPQLAVGIRFAFPTLPTTSGPIIFGGSDTTNDRSFISPRLSVSGSDRKLQVFTNLNGAGGAWMNTDTAPLPWEAGRKYTTTTTFDGAEVGLWRDGEELTHTGDTHVTLRMATTPVEIASNYDLVVAVVWFAQGGISAGDRIALESAMEVLAP